MLDKIKYKETSTKYAILFVGNTTKGGIIMLKFQDNNTTVIAVSYTHLDVYKRQIGEHDDYSGIYVWSNAVHLKKILMNLFTNSMKYNKVDVYKRQPSDL